MRKAETVEVTRVLLLPGYETSDKPQPGERPIQ